MKYCNECNIEIPRLSNKNVNKTGLCRKCYHRNHMRMIRELRRAHGYPTNYPLTLKEIRTGNVPSYIDAKEDRWPKAKDNVRCLSCSNVWKPDCPIIDAVCKCGSVLVRKHTYA